MKKLKLFALTVAALIGVTGVANAASATMLAQDDFVGISFWIIQWVCWLLQRSSSWRETLLLLAGKRQ